MKTLYLIDGYAQFFRAFHAIRTPMTSPVTSEPTNATFGFVGMLLKLLRECKPDFVAVALDVSGDRGTFRSEIYPEYKANRDEPPETFRPQVRRCVSLLEALHIPVLGSPGFEADDVLATLATRLGNESDLRIRIISKDKDLQQLLVDGRVELYDVHRDEVIDEAQLRADKGIAPDQVVDMLALMGDNVDNVPGVPGVGPKTAAQLIAKWGSLDELLAHADEIKGKRGENIRASAALLEMSRRLVTLEREVPVDFDLDAAAVERIRLPDLPPILRELGFNRFEQEVRDLMEAPSARAASSADSSGAIFGEGLFDQIAPPPDAAAGDYTCVRTPDQLDEMIGALRGADLIAVDTETTGLSPRRCDLCGLSFSVSSGAGWYVPVRSSEPETHMDWGVVRDRLRDVLEDAGVAKCGHNLKYDLLVLRSHGVELRGLVFDTMVASYLIDASRSAHGLDHLALAMLGHTCMPISDLIRRDRQEFTFDRVPLEQATPYAAEDADVALRLVEVMRPQLSAMNLKDLFEGVEMPLVRVLAELEWNGILVDPDELDRQADRLRGRLETLRREIMDASPRPFNPDSPKQLASVMFNKPEDAEEGLGLKPIKKLKTGYSTDSEVLEKLSLDPDVETSVPALILEYRKLTKLVGTYLVALKEEINPETGRIHASFNQTVAATGRLSSSDPNLQNIPIRTEDGREIRKAFIAPPGHVLVSADYSQIELRILAHLSRDEALIRAFLEGADIHRAVAAQIHEVSPEDVTTEQRSGAKMVNFGIIYGVTPFGLARRLRISKDEAATIISDYKRRFPGITTFLEECVDQARRYGYVETMLGRRRPITEVDARNPARRALAERIAINSVVQGSAADLIKLAMTDLHDRLSEHSRRVLNGGTPEIPGVRMLLQIHDELLFECPEDAGQACRELVTTRMSSAMKLEVPLIVDSALARTWFEGK